MQVLTTGSWPTHPALMCSLPREVEACCSDFKAFYLRTHSGRKLQWQTNMGNAGAPCLGQMPCRHGSAQSALKCTCKATCKGACHSIISALLVCLLMLWHASKGKSCHRHISERHIRSQSMQCHLLVRRLRPACCTCSPSSGCCSLIRPLSDSEFCSADLRADFDGRKHELNVSTYQMAILMLFNAADSLSYHEIQAATSIPPADLKRSLQSLACAKASHA